MENSKQNSSRGSEKANRNAVCYFISFSSANLAIEKEEESDDFFEQTTQDLKYRQRDLVRQSALEANRPFLPRSFLENKNRERKAESYKHTVIRLSFDNTFIVQALFFSNEPVFHLFEFVTDLLSSAQQHNCAFNLYLFRHPLTDHSEKSLMEAGIAPMSKITVHTFTDGSLEQLLQCVTSKIKETDVSLADQISKEWLSVNTDFIPFEHTLMNTEGSNESVSAAKRFASMISGKTEQNENEKEEDVPTHPVDYSKYSTPKSDFPKWFKGKN